MVMRLMRSDVLFPAVLLCAVSACGGSSVPEKKAEPEASEKVAATPGPSASALQAEGPQGVLKGYEAVRKALAEDRLEDAVQRAGVLATVAEGVEVEGAGADALGKLAKSAAALAAMTGRKPDEIRKTFGEVSSAAVELLSQRPDLQNGVHMFECPMAQGYKRWLQPSPQIENPYMGQQMLECGSERTF